MPRLEINLLGPFQATLDGIPLSGFDSDKVRALLAYLAVEADRPHRREKLAGLLWPDYPDRSARTSLRRALANLRQVIADSSAAPAFLLVTPQTIQFNHRSAANLDVAVLKTAADWASCSIADKARLETAAGLYRGRFLEGFSLADSSVFEEWQLVTAEALQGVVGRVLACLGWWYEREGRYEAAADIHRRRTQIDAYEESAHQDLMRVLALNGQRAAALAHFEGLVQLLETDLGVSPAAGTRQLYEQIQVGEALGTRQGTQALRTLQGYELRELLGIGHFGAVYRAYQPALQRDVAIKFIQPEYANRPGFIRRFEREAQFVARLEHPHIVPLYDYWRDPQGAYLVMRWLRGGSLANTLERGAWHIDAAAQLVEQVALALAAAHRQGIIHQDIKPDNILLDETGNAYLADFGIARLVEPAALLAPGEVPGEETFFTGSPVFAAPEAIRGEPLTRQADIFNLGVLLYTLLMGEPPLEGLPDDEIIHLRREKGEDLVYFTRLNELPVEIQAVIRKATAWDPVERYPDVLSLVGALHQAVTGQVIPGLTMVQEREVRNPFKGLRPFQESDAGDFFGRADLTRRLVARLGENQPDVRFLAVVGPSGSGKSSVVKAGLLPALRQGALPGAENWFYVEMIPGAHPLEELEAALLRVAVNPPEKMLEQLQAGSRGLLRAVNRTLPAGRDTELFLVIDQFEEVFTLPEEPDLAKYFLDNLYTAVTDPDSRLRVVLTLRADFYDQPLLYPAFGELVRSRTETVLPLSTREIMEAIEDPAANVGLVVEPGLAARIAADLQERPGTLPLLQYSLTELFENRTGNILGQAAYEAIGGVAGALGRRAEAIFNQLSLQNQKMVQQVFLRLVVLGEGTEDTRRRVLLPELDTLADVAVEGGLQGQSQIIREVLDVYGKARLLTFDRQPITRTPTVEIAHEALLQRWVRLKNWLVENREDIRLQRVLNNEAMEWLDAEKDASYLLRGAQLDHYESWMKNTRVGLNEIEREYLEASLDERQKEQMVEVLRMEREEKLEKRSRNFLRVMVVALSVATIFALALSWVMLQQRNSAQQQTRMLISQELVNYAQGSFETDPQLGLLLTLHAVEMHYQAGDPISPEMERTLHRAIAQPRLLQRLYGPNNTNVFDIVYGLNGQMLFAATDPRGQIPETMVWDTSTWENLYAIPGAFSPSYLEAHPQSNTMTTFKDFVENDLMVFASWDLENQVELDTRQIRVSPEFRWFGIITGDFSPDGRLVGATLQVENSKIVTLVWEMETGKEIYRWINDAQEFDFILGFSKDSQDLFIGTDNGKVFRVRLTDGAELYELDAHEALVLYFDLCQNREMFVTTSTDQTAKLWSAETGELLATLRGHSSRVNQAVFSQDCTRLATSSSDNTVKLWDVQASQIDGVGKELFTLSQEGVVMLGLAFHPDGTQLAVGVTNGDVLIWDIETSSEWIAVGGNSAQRVGGPSAFVLSPDGARLLATSADSEIKVWDTESGAVLFSLTGHTDQVRAIAYSPDGETIASAGDDGTVQVWDGVQGDLLVTIAGYTEGCCALAFAPEAPVLAVGSPDGEVSLFNWLELSRKEENVLPRQSSDRVIQAHEGGVTRVVYTQDGTHILTSGIYGEGGGRPARVWDVKTGLRQRLEFYGWDWEYTILALSPDGQLLLTSNHKNPPQLWDLESGKLVQSFSGHSGQVYGASFSPDGSRLATAGADGKVNLWEVSTGLLLYTLQNHAGGVTDVVYSPDGRRLYTLGADGTVHGFKMDIGELLEQGRGRVTRELTPTECLQYLGGENCSLAAP